MLGKIEKKNDIIIYNILSYFFYFYWRLSLRFKVMRPINNLNFLM